MFKDSNILQLSMPCRAFGRSEIVRLIIAKTTAHDNKTRRYAMP